jgi:Lipase (class 3)
MDPAEMLTLAAITYRGCEFNLSNAHSRKIVYDEVARCLITFGATRGKWELAWGPAGYRPGITGTDISAMYAVRGIGATSTSNLAIVIRGTNFFSPLDWLSNLLIDTKPWEYGGAANNVEISHSTWLGLRILQRLQSGPVPAPPATQTPVEQAQAAETAAQAAVVYAFLKDIIQGGAPFDIATYLTQIEEQIVAIARGSFAPEPDLQQAIDDARRPFASAGTLLEFLKGFVANAAPPVNIYVIGHSKSGALAPAFALWLADTQGKTISSLEQWDPGSKANLRFYSFSAPTPGNAGFAARFKRKITDYYRLENPYDIVPHVWDPNEVRKIPDLYGDQLMALRIPADALALALQVPAYQHEAPSEPWTGTAVPQSNFLKRAAVEHLDSYLKTFGLYDASTLSILALFAPIP